MTKEDINDLASKLYKLWAQRTENEPRWGKLTPDERSTWRRIARRAAEQLDQRVAGALGTDLLKQ